jgi:hypothetical protein
MASEGMTKTNNWLASANGICRDDLDKQLISFASEWMTEMNKWLASTNGIQRDDQDKRLISLG